MITEIQMKSTEGKVCLRQHTRVFIGLGAFLRLGASEADPETKIILQGFIRKGSQEKVKEVRGAGQGRQKSHQVCDFRQSP